MRLPSIPGSKALLLTAILNVFSSTSAEPMLVTKALNPCPGSTNAQFTATLFDVVFTANNRTLTYNINAISSISQKVTAQLVVIAYGYTAFNQTIDPCANKDLISLCPLNPGPIPIKSNFVFSESAVKQIPSIAYGVPDLDGVVRVYIKNRETGEELACVEAELSNGQTVNQPGVQWAIAVVAGLGLLVSAITSGLGHSNTAAHVAANALSLFGFFQAQAMIGMTSVSLPPIFQSWTQNFEWSMGMVSIGFMQNVCTWYQRSTGGTPTTLLSALGTTSVQVQKRSMEMVKTLLRRGYHDLAIRDASSTTKTTVVKGITRVGFKANIELTNIFLTGLGFFVAFVIIVAISVALFKAFCEVAVKAGWLKSDKFSDFRNGWKIVLKGILFRIVLIGYPQMSILCLWELTVRDSAAEVVLALFYFVTMSVVLAWAAFKVIRIAKRSVAMHKNPAYILYSDPTSLNKWGFLYVQFRATAYYFIVPTLIYILCKSLFIAFAQDAPIAQAVGLLVIEGVTLIGLSILRPWMDRSTNAFNIAIASMNFLNVIFLLVFSNVFNQPANVTGIMGVVIFAFNAIFALVLLLLLIFASVYAIVVRNPDSRYQPMRDDRGSFIKSQTNLTTELDALGATARGDMKMKSRDLDEDSDSFSSASARHHHDALSSHLPVSTVASSRSVNQYERSQSPIDASVPFIPSDGTPRHGTPSGYHDNAKTYNGNALYGSGYDRNANNGSPAPRSFNASPAPRSFNASPAPRSFNNSPAPVPQFNHQSYEREGSVRSNTSYRPQNSAPAWHVGAGYDR